MFVLWSLFKIAAVPLTLLFVGMILMPVHVLFPLVGGVTIVAGLVMLMVDPLVGIALLVLGVGMVIIGLKLRARLEREQNEQDEENADRISRMMSFHLPTDEDH